MAAPTLVATRILQNAGTTTAINTTGATTFVVFGMVYAGGGTAPALPTFTDSVGNTYTLVDSYTVATGSSSDTLGIWICKVGTGSASHTWSFSLGASGQFPVFCVAALSGCAAEPVDDHKEANYTASGTYSSGALTLSQANDLVLGFTGVDADNGWLPVAGSGYTLDQALNAANALSGGLEHQTFGSSGSQAATFTFSTTGPDMRAVMVAAIALKASVGTSNSAAGTSALGALGASATTAAQNATAGSSNAGALSASASISANNASAGLGNLAKLAAAGSVVLAASLGGNSALGPIHTAATVAATESAAGSSRFGAIASNGSASARAGATAASTVGPMASAGGIGAAASAAGVSTFGGLVCAGTIPYTHQNTLAGASAFGALSSAGSALASQAIAGGGQIGGLLGAGTALQHTSAVGVSVFGGLLSSGTIPFQNFNTLSGVSLLGPIGSGGAINASQSAAGASTFAPLACHGTIPAGILSLPADPLYYIQMPPRAFYAALPSRPFYILSNPNMTPTFSNLDPRETEVLTFDASSDLGSGETLTAIETVTVTVQSGAPTATPPDLTGQLINGAPVTLTVNGKTITIATGCCVQVVASGGVSNCQYLIAITCNTSNPDKVLVLKGILPVNAQ